MPRASSIRRLVASDYPADQRRFVETLNSFLTSTTDAIGSLPNVVVREITVTMPDDWRQPTLNGLWTTLYGPIGYRKDVEGFVTLRGTVTGGTYGTTALFTLPSACRPSVLRTLPVAQSSVYEPGGVVQVFPTGEVVAPAVTSVQTGASAYLALDAVRFQASDLSVSAPLSIALTAGNLSAVTGVVAVACFDVTTGSPVGAPLPSVAWAPVATGIKITALVGLSASRRYTIRLVLLAF